MAHRHRRFGFGQSESQALEPFAPSSSAYPAWPGVPLGAGVTFIATKVLPDFKEIQSDWLYPVPYMVPALALGLALLTRPRTRRMGYGTLGGALGYYLYAAVWNKAQTAEYRRQARLARR